ncbi:glucosidase [Marinilabiliaceae bacterium JC017]|nr:glucosidase [Marinilabiliaceae bacterium JC017]
MKAEHERIAEKADKNSRWNKWGPYLSERQWGTVREDYSADGNAWGYITHDKARSYAYRWGEEGIGGICDKNQYLCFSLALWNGHDPFIKERLFGLSGAQGNHGEDVKEYYYYLDNVPSHSYMKMLYKYPHQAFPYKQLIEENAKRNKQEEYELVDTGIFDEQAYFDVFIEYGKVGPEDLLIRITAVNRGFSQARLDLLPQLWFRNTWSWGYDAYRPRMCVLKDKHIKIEDDRLNTQPYFLYVGDSDGQLLFCDNETNTERLYDYQGDSVFYKDGINDFVVKGQDHAINWERSGTKVAINYPCDLEPGASKVVTLRLSNAVLADPFVDFNDLFLTCINDADAFYVDIQAALKNEDAKNIQRQAYAGMLWSKQFYYFDVPQWLNGDPAMPSPPGERQDGRNREWLHLNNADIISMPDKWEYPWYAAWDLAFHCISFAKIDVIFAKQQLILLTREWYMHPNGQLPAYEWNFSDVNPPVHAWAAWEVYEMEKQKTGQGDMKFLEAIFHKLLINFTWWVNRKDLDNRNVFQGGFLGLDNIGVFDRSASLPGGGRLEQADATSWMAMYCLNMMRMALELAIANDVYENMATKFFEHFLLIAGAMNNVGGEGIQIWDDEDEFFYDVLHIPGIGNEQLKIRSIVGLIPLFAVEVLDADLLAQVPEFAARLKWFLTYRPDLAKLVSRWEEGGVGHTHLLSLLRGHRMKCLVKKMVAQTEFLSDYGVRSMSAYHHINSYCYIGGGQRLCISYVPGESDSDLFGGNSNWRGPIWFPINYMLIKSMVVFHRYYGDDFLVEYPSGSGRKATLLEIARQLAGRLANIFLKNSNGNRPVFGNKELFQSSPYFRDNLLFYEYFHGDNGKGLGASHQTGWTGLITEILEMVEGL